MNRGGTSSCWAKYDGALNSPMSFWYRARTDSGPYFGGGAIFSTRGGGVTSGSRGSCTNYGTVATSRNVTRTGRAATGGSRSSSGRGAGYGSLPGVSSRAGNRRYRVWSYRDFRGSCYNASRRYEGRGGLSGSRAMKAYRWSNGCGRSRSGPTASTRLLFSRRSVATGRRCGYRTGATRKSRRWTRGSSRTKGGASTASRTCSISSRADGPTARTGAT